MQESRFTVNKEYENLRLDRFLKEIHTVPFHLIQKLIRKKQIRVNGSRTSNDYSLQNGDVITIKYFEQPTNSKKKKQPAPKLYKDLLAQIQQNIVFKDENIIAINKPYDTAVQGGSKIKISIDDILKDLKFELNDTPRLVHRLDKYTSGILLLARSKEIAQELMKLFKEKQIQKYYKAIVLGKPSKPDGIIETKLKKNTSGDTEKIIESEDGKESITKFNLTQNFGSEFSILDFEPVTGRTHQIRVHASELLKTPILGDRKYGGKKSIVSCITNKTKLHLASYRVCIHDLKGKRYDISCQLPDHIKKTIEELSIKY